MTETINLSHNWRKWLNRFENFLEAMDIKEEKRKRALLLHCAGTEVYDIYSTLPVAETDTYSNCAKALTDYFNPKQNIRYERYKFRIVKQLPEESIDTYVTRLRELAQGCAFTDVDDEILTQVIVTCSSNNLRRKALQQDLSLHDLLKVARAIEIADHQATAIEKGDGLHVHNLTHKNTQDNQAPKQKKCYRCGQDFPHSLNKCPAIGQTCSKCRKGNHFAAVCKSAHPKSPSPITKPENIKVVNQEAEGMSIVENYVFNTSIAGSVQSPCVTLTICSTDITFTIDTGASVDNLDSNAYERLKTKPALQPVHTKIFPYGSQTPLATMGQFDAEIIYKENTQKTTFHTLEGSGGCLLSYHTALKLGLIQVIHTITDPADMDIQTMVNSFSSLFSGLGKLKDFQVHIHVDDSVHPVAQAHRRIPFHLRQKVEEELKLLMEEDIIETVTGPTPWVSPLVVVPKPKNPEQVRLCVDMRLPNVAIQRERHISPTIDDIIHLLNGATVFSKLDLNKGYHQLELSPESRYVTTFSTHVGLRRYKRLTFGVCSAAEIFQDAIRSVIQHIPNAFNYSDDILVFGKTQAEHNRALYAIFECLLSSGLTLNKEKCEFNKSSLEFYGHIFSAEGVQPDPKKVEAIRAASIPQNASEVRSFLGMASYCARYIPNFSTISTPLRDLTKHNCVFLWSQDCQASFDAIKKELCSTTTMAYFDPTLRTELIVDASPVGLGAILAQYKDNNQNPHIISYASKSLTNTEKKYSQPEKESLAVVWGCEHFHLFIYGAPFTIVTDHQALLTIFGNPRAKMPARIERWGLRLQDYNYTIVHKPGKYSNPADYLSRHPSNDDLSVHCFIEEYIRFVAVHDIPKALSITQFVNATTSDKTMCALIQIIQNRRWHEIQKEKFSGSDIDVKELILFSNVREELSVTEEHLILRGTKLVVPKALRNLVIQIAHEGHLGIVGTKKLLREKVWFPNMDQMVEEKIRLCSTCQLITPSSRSEPLQMSPLPAAVWEEVAVDIYGPLPNGQYILVTIDEYSRYPAISFISSTSANSVIPELDNIFSAYGIPRVVKTDNGPPFNGHVFTQFSEYLGFSHRKITPCWPQANGIVERFMRTLGKRIKAANLEHTPLKQSLYKFLRNYRNTPHSTTNVAPAHLLFGRTPRIRIPDVTNHSVPSDSSVRSTDFSHKQAMKYYADRRRRAQPCNIKRGDTVVVRQRQTNKTSAVFGPERYRVTAKKGTMVTAEQNGHSITRNSSHFKIIPQNNATDLPLGEDLATESGEGIREEGNPSMTEGNHSMTDTPNESRRYPTRERRTPSRLIEEV